MNFVFCREKHQLPKYAIGTRPHVINSVKMVSNSVPRGKKPNSTAHTFILNMLVENEFRIAAKKKKTSIVYINPHLDAELIQNIRKHLSSIEIKVSKFFLVDDGTLESIHSEVDAVISRK